MGTPASQEEIRSALGQFALEDVSDKQQNFIASLIKQIDFDSEKFKELIAEKTAGDTKYNKRQASKIIEHMIELRDQNRAKKEKKNDEDQEGHGFRDSDVEAKFEADDDQPPF